jgi:hypothetical protein
VEAAGRSLAQRLVGDAIAIVIAIGGDLLPQSIR